MFKSRPKNTNFYCRRDNCIIGECPLGNHLDNCPLRVDCQAWHRVAATSAMTAPGPPASHSGKPNS